ncbi:hypothetical protein JCGZ_20750 [Jatropha curcas]|uniref:Glycine-rich protein n=1 Tax=Jatropha curcas TaxID=180498 RepID=A0A067K1C6_JATCU|nr:hypothetical protein JCGZ_20750 [Jatropha curcas]
MSRRRGRGDFGDPFGGFGAFGGLFGNAGGLMSGLLGGRDPFDDPFFTAPFGGMFPPNFMGYNGNPFPDMHPSAFPQHQAPEPKFRRGPIIEEINSDDEKEKVFKKKKENPRIHGRSSKQPDAVVDDEDDEVEDREHKHLQYRNGHNRFTDMEQQPRNGSFTFQSSTVTYGGGDGAYYTSSMTRRTGSDGVTFEERKEADSSTRQATHEISRGLYNKGHTFTRKLNSDGKVNTMQTLHNLHEDELAGFEEAWDGNTRKYLPGWNGNFSGHDGVGAGSSRQFMQARQESLALPSTESQEHLQRTAVDARNKAGFSRMQHTISGKSRGSSDIQDKRGYSRG